MKRTHRSGSVELAQAVLRAAGVHADVEVAGFARDVAVIHARGLDPLRLRDLVPSIKAAGFRYVTVDLAVTTADV